MSEIPRLDESVEFAENPEPRCPCVLLLDISGSMDGAPIESLNAGLQAFKDTLIEDSLAARRVEVAMVTFDSEVNAVQDFITVDMFIPPILTAQGFTHMGGAILRGLDMIQARKEEYRANGISYYRPWMFMITDGRPEGEDENIIEEASRRIRDDEAEKRVVFFAVGVENADMDILRQIAVRTPVKLMGLNFKEMFIWLSTSMSRVSQSKVGDQIELPPPGWSTIE